MKEAIRFFIMCILCQDLYFELDFIFLYMCIENSYVCGYIL